MTKRGGEVGGWRRGCSVKKAESPIMRRPRFEVGGRATIVAVDVRSARNEAYPMRNEGTGENKGEGKKREKEKRRKRKREKATKGGGG